ncbi:MAG: hypothetical protein WC371_01560 [Parachlamydiales bacterium]|jgi:hypothetical protein
MKTSSFNPETIFQNQENCFLSDLIPYNTLEKRAEVDFKTELNDYLTMLQLLEAAIDAQHGQFWEKFDAEVGENACQIRAFFLALVIAPKNAFSPNLQLAELKTTIAKIRSQVGPALSSVNTLPTTSSLHEFLKEHNLLIKLKAPQVFLLLCFILSETKLHLEKTDKLFRLCKTVPKLLKSYGNISTHFADKLIKKSRQKLSWLSVEFIQELALLAKDLELQEMVSEKYILRHNQCFCLPIFWSCKTILRLALVHKIPFVLHVKIQEKNLDGIQTLDEGYAFFKTAETCVDFKAADLNQAAVVIQGIAVNTSFKNKTLWKEQIQKYSLSEILLAGAADHKQYPDSTQDQRITSLNNLEHKFYQNFARQTGFALDNPSLFFIQHIYTIKQFFPKAPF